MRWRAGAGDGRVGRDAAASSRCCCAGLVAAGVRVPGAAAGAGGGLADSLRGCAGGRLRGRAGADRGLWDGSGEAGAASTCRRCSSSRGRGRCRSTFGAAASTACGDGCRARASAAAPTPACRSPPSSTWSTAGRRRRSDSEADGADCSGSRAGNLYIQYWTYYADSATLRGVPIAGDAGLPPRRLGGGADPHPARRLGRRARLLPQRLQPRPGGRQLGLGRRHRPAQGRGRSARRSRAANGWGPETHLLLVSGGSHAGNAAGIPHIERLTPATAST